MLTSRERVLKAIAHKETDRVPLDFWSREDVIQRLKAYLGLTKHEQLYKRLGIDLRTIVVNEYHPEFEQKTTGILVGTSESCGRRYIIHEDGRFEDAWGVVRRLGSNRDYDQWLSGPFKYTKDLDAFNWPKTDIFDTVDALADSIESFRGEYALVGRVLLPFKTAWHMRGLENFLCDMITDVQLVHDLLERIAVYEEEKGTRLVRAGVDIIGIYGDIATQDRMLVDPRVWRKIEKPILARMIQRFKRENPNISVLFHSDGNIIEVLPDLIEIGFNIINPIQPECMDPEEVKRRYGNLITLHGTISIQKTMPRGSVEDVRTEV
jgi:uroporphyrinogen decarboxylase